MKVFSVAVILAAAAVVLPAADVYGQTITDCSSTADCGDNEYCSTVDMKCVMMGDCTDDLDCTDNVENVFASTMCIGTMHCIEDAGNPGKCTNICDGTEATCSAYETCEEEDLDADCCPDINGKFLACCAGIENDDSSPVIMPIVQPGDDRTECSSTADCDSDEGEYCSTIDGTCLKMGDCSVVEDCTNNADNIFAIPMCMGQLYCIEDAGNPGRCVQVCDGTPSECSSYGSCSGLDGNCCPNDEGKFLACCADGQVDEETPVTMPINPEEENPVTMPINPEEENPVTMPINPEEENPVIMPIVPDGETVAPTGDDDAVDPEFGVDPPVDPEFGVDPPVDPEFGVDPPVDPEFGVDPDASLAPTQDPQGVDPEFGVDPEVDPEFGVDPPPACIEYDGCNDCLAGKCSWVPVNGCLTSCDIVQSDTACYESLDSVVSTDKIDQICQLAASDGEPPESSAAPTQDPQGMKDRSTNPPSGAPTQDPQGLKDRSSSVPSGEEVPVPMTIGTDEGENETDAEMNEEDGAAMMASFPSLFFAFGNAILMVAFSTTVYGTIL